MIFEFVLLCRLFKSGSTSSLDRQNQTETNFSLLIRCFRIPFTTEQRTQLANETEKMADPRAITYLNSQRAIAA